MKILFASIFVDDQAKALKFYTEVLGFVKKEDIPVGEFRWLTVVSPEGHADVELVLEPNANPASLAYQKAIYGQGIAATLFITDDVRKEYERLKKLGVVFKSPLTDSGPVVTAVFDDTCGNLISIVQRKG